MRRHTIEFLVEGGVYIETLIRAIDEVRFEKRWSVWASVKGEKCVVKMWRWFIPVTLLIVDGKRVRVLREEGFVIWMAYEKRSAAQEPLRRLINELRFRKLVSY
ncbi:MAG: hypothetical protein RUDDFDWM_000037 [Candidatus Fervidibacterota bacterium]